MCNEIEGSYDKIVITIVQWYMGRDRSFVAVGIVPGFHTEGGRGLEFPPGPSHDFPYPEILKLSMVIILAIYMLLNVSMCHQNVWKFCPRLHQKQSERYINSKFSWRGGGHAPIPP